MSVQPARVPADDFSLPAVVRAALRGDEPDRPRTVVVPAPAQDAIRGMALNTSGLLFESPRGKAWTTGSHGHYWRRLRLLADRPKLTFYELRHCAATMLLERGVSPWDVAVQLGHTDGGWLVQTLYGHPSEDAARARVAAAYDPEVAPLRAAQKPGRRP